jgi:hypothetical protein
VKRLMHVFWPTGAPLAIKLAASTQAIMAILAILVALLDVMGFWEVSGEVFEELILFAVGVFLLASALDAAGRASAGQEQRALLDATRAAAGVLEVRQVSSGDIGIGLERLLEESAQWTFRGGSGRWLRFATLMTLSKIRDQDVAVDIQILDPRDGDLSAQYAIYRDRQRPGLVRRPDEGDPRTIQADLLAVIYAAAWYSANSRIKAHVLLLRSFSRLRYDIGSTGLFVTVADPKEPGLYAKSSSWYYSSILDELRQNEHGHPRVVLPVDRALFPSDSMNVTASVVEGGLRATTVVEPLTGASSPLLTGAVDPASVDFGVVADRVFVVDDPY